MYMLSFKFDPSFEEQTGNPPRYTASLIALVGSFFYMLNIKNGGSLMESGRFSMSFCRTGEEVTPYDTATYKLSFFRSPGENEHYKAHFSSKYTMKRLLKHIEPCKQLKGFKIIYSNFKV